MHQLLEGIFETGIFTNSKGDRIQVHSITTKEQCAFLRDVLQQNQSKNSIEVGLAYGTSALTILEEVSSRSGHHTVIDPHQEKFFSNNGLDLINQSGLADNLTFLHEFSYTALPRLLAEEKTYDFAYIDSTKLMDYLMVDFFYIDKMLGIGGVIVFDDVDFPSIRKLLRYLAQLPHYEVIGNYPKNREPVKTLKKSLFNLVIPEQKKYLRSDLALPDYDLQVNSQCVALRKISQDQRNWKWHHSF